MQVTRIIYLGSDQDLGEQYTTHNMMSAYASEERNRLLHVLALSQIILA
jgi:hypothetical protein